MSILIEGKGSKKLFQNEAGGHRWQIASPTDKRKRVHTSTVTVAVLDPLDKSFNINVNDIEYILTRGTGPGGMNRNKVESCVVARHIPTGISVRIDARDQHKNKALATSILMQRVREIKTREILTKRHNKRKEQQGSGCRSDKIRTYTKHCVKDHKLIREMSLKRFMKGYIDDLWK